jgi:hypothetical protein
MEYAVLQQRIKNSFILRPSLISGERKEQRIGEKIALLVFKLMQPLLIGNLKQYKTIDAENIAKAMLYLANKKMNAEVIITSNQILKLSKK